jgi:hypothetical protein
VLPCQDHEHVREYDARCREFAAQHKWLSLPRYSITLNTYSADGSTRPSLAALPAGLLVSLLNRSFLRGLRRLCSALRSGDQHAAVPPADDAAGHEVVQGQLPQVKQLSKGRRRHQHVLASLRHSHEVSWHRAAAIATFCVFC